MAPGHWLLTTVTSRPRLNAARNWRSWASRTGRPASSAIRAGARDIRNGQKLG
jgi:hypothetical protein